MANTITSYPNLSEFPLLQYMKQPVELLSDLYTKYPTGGAYGWFVWVNQKRTFYYWDVDTDAWSPLSMGSLYELLGIDESLLVDGDVPVWDSETKKYTIINLSVWGTEEY